MRLWKPSDEARDAVLWTAFGTALGILLLYTSTRKVDPDALTEALRSADLIWAIGILGATAGFIAIKAWRWRLLLGFVPEIRFGKLHGAVYAGLAANFLISHVGEFLRAALVARENRVSTSAILASIVVERALDFVALLVLLVLVSLVPQELPDFVKTARAMVAVVLISATAAFLMLLHPPQWFGSVLASAPMPERARLWLSRQVEQFRHGLTSIGDSYLMLLAILASVLQWSLVIAAIWFCGNAVGATASLVAVTATFVLIVIGLALPNAPMQVGTTQLAFAIGFSAGGTPATPAIAASLIYTIFLIVPIMIVGGVYLLRRGPSARSGTVQ